MKRLWRVGERLQYSVLKDATYFERVIIKPFNSFLLTTPYSESVLACQAMMTSWEWLI